MSRTEYLTLRARVDAHADSVAARRPGALHCRAGCSGCCQVQLTLSAFEARFVEAGLERLDPSRRAAIAHRASGGLGPSDPCVMLERDGRCAIYEDRPLVCRSQGLPLRYPEGVIPAEALRGRVGAGELTICPLNFVDAPPEPEDVLDAERIDILVGLMARLAATANGEDPEDRVALSALARPSGAAEAT